MADWKVVVGTYLLRRGTDYRKEIIYDDERLKKCTEYVDKKVILDETMYIVQKLLRRILTKRAFQNDS